MSDYQPKITICRTNLRIFCYSLLWPDEQTELNPGLTYKIKVFIYFFLTGVANLSISIHFYLAAKYNQPLNAEDVAVFIATFGSYYMICSYVKQQQKIALLLQDLSDFRRFGEPPDFQKLNKLLNVLTKLLFGYVSAVTTFYNLEKFLEKKECKRIHAEVGAAGQHCGLVAPFWCPFEIDYFPVFQLFIIMGYLLSMLHLKMCLLISFHGLEIVQHIILRLKHLKILILECINAKNRFKLITCVTYHIEILRFAERMDQIFSTIMFGHFALTGTICACLEKQIVDGDNLYAGVLHFTGWIIALFVSCLGGQFLTDAGQIIPETLQISEWYQLDNKFKKDLLIILMRAQKYPHLNAGPFGVLGYPLFVSVLKTSYSILCVLTS